MCIPKYRLRLRWMQPGFTLVELVIFIVIVSVALIGILQVLNMTTRNSVDPQLRKQALSIAEALMERVSSARFTFCDPADPNAENATSAANCAIVEAVGPENGTLDNVNDHVAAFGVPQAIAIADVNGVNAPNLAAYAARLTITPQALGAVPADASLLITIEVSYGAETIRLDGYRTRYAPNWMP